ncbi:hypothetical protein A2316_03235 [Candidatus Falkowbacteria bacterium RIFOXYB2_FULL_38_15]|uniref:Uncharacterized protein n=1 Tax=Candidatus Falkowbacteria bacterium RIFOXYA2_FULL_38_12 TaxID=1797993 RepID=A0A1F5S3S5_9BACT|nr:MAG: hypothetical protein A2257_01000 [Candidatus Falkowbacteria bacterium RIFOXYA2_FULL_38_12]OGF33737.1 MAG: hypothetical protein A2316_03235 [Candidatus Falkowbacteria bacterium RIFOXYB2_FULL_38_15]OGF42393.1 MAG: hypothetical protein A2555_00400 [Candidatus Falkowbacteria bacterium RIFOXYD2_FULL_39_16]
MVQEKAPDIFEGYNKRRKEEKGEAPEPPSLVEIMERLLLERYGRGNEKMKALDYNSLGHFLHVMQIENPDLASGLQKYTERQKSDAMLIAWENLTKEREQK